MLCKVTNGPNLLSTPQIWVNQFIWKIGFGYFGTQICDAAKMLGYTVHVIAVFKPLGYGATYGEL